MSAVQPAGGSAAAGRRGMPPGQLLLGIVLLGCGAGWLLDALGLLQLRVGALLATALVAVGVVLLLDARRCAHTGLILLGVALTVALAASSATRALDLQARGGIGDRVVRPAEAAALGSPQRLGIGTLTLDLAAVELPAGSTTTIASVGIGSLVVQAPPGVGVQVRGRVGLGRLEALGRARDGAQVDTTITAAGFATAERRLVLDLSVGVGSIEVRP